MTGRLTRRRWLAALMMALTAGSITVAQVSIPTPPLVISPPTVKERVPPTVAALPPPVVPLEVPPPKIEPLTLPKVPLIVAEEPPPAVVPPSVPALTTGIVKAAKPAMAEIIASGPTAIDASKAFAVALAEAKAAHAKVRDYTGHLIVQERVKGTLTPEQMAEVRVRLQPRSLAVKFIAPGTTVGRELVYADGRNGGKVRAKAAGTYGPLAFASVAVSDAKAAVTSRLSLADIGLLYGLDRVERAMATEAKLRNAVTVLAADFSFGGKTVTRYEVCFDRAHALRDAARMVLCLDPDTKLPVRFEVFDAPAAGKLEGALRESVSYVNLSFNKGIGDAAFDK